MENKPIRQCSYCKKELDKREYKCSYCGKDSRNFFMQNKVLSGIIIVVIIFVVSRMFGGGGGGKANDDVVQGINDVSGEIVITAEDLARAFEEDNDKAESDYKGKVVSIEGTIMKKATAMGKTYVALSTYDGAEVRDVRCFFKEQEEIDKLADVNEGDTIIVEGEITQKAVFITVENCKLK
ncbi:OB-fold putative lipoprotein [Tissierella pigra]|nr:hypothetical protein [Tissierella pigra]MBU5425405.1 OB-fold putative lipoprotein [Tissierella pigra]